MFNFKCLKCPKKCIAQLLSSKYAKMIGSEIPTLKTTDGFEHKY